MNFLEMFKTDEKIEKEGICLEFGDSRFHVKRAGKSNKAFVVALSLYHKKNKFQIEHEILDDKKALPELAKIYFDTVSVGWENVRSLEDDTLLECNRENYVKLMVNFPEFFDEYRTQVSARANFQAEEIEEDSKN